MASKLKLRIGVADDPTALQPSLNDCLAAMLQQAEPLFLSVLKGLEQGLQASGPRRIASLQAAPVRNAVLALHASPAAITASFVEELTRLVYEGGGKDQSQPELLRFEDLQLFKDDELDQSIEVARAQQEVALAVDDALPPLDALISTMLGWRTIQPGLNPIRPDVFVRALQAALAAHVPQPQLREVLITPAAGLLGVQLRQLYRELGDWLRSTGIEPAVPLGGRVQKSTGASASPVNDTVARTLLTLDRLRKLLAGDFDPPRKPDFLHTVPASMALLEDLKKTDALVRRLEQRPAAPAAPAAPAEPQDMLAELGGPAAQPAVRIGQRLGEEVVQLMFDSLAEDRRLLPGLKQRLKKMEPAVLRLAASDSRFFSDRTHPARLFLDRVTQRSLAFGSEQDPGCARFLASLDNVESWLASKVIDAETFGEMLEQLEGEWDRQDEGAKVMRQEAARALLHAEQRNLLAQKIAADFQQQLHGLQIADFVRDFLKGAWAQVVAEAQLSCVDGSLDPYGYRALVDDLLWSVQKTARQRGRARRLVQMIPGLLQRLRAGLQGIGYPPELTQRFFDHLITLHRAAVQEGREAAAQARADETEGSQFSDTAQDEIQLWLDQHPDQEAGASSSEPLLATRRVASAEAAQQEAQEAAQEERALQADASTAASAEASGEALRIGTWAEIQVEDTWVRAQLTWCSPHATLFMFTSIAGTAHSMSRRTLDKLRASGALRVVAQRPVVEEALDQVAQAALKNSLGKP